MCLLGDTVLLASDCAGAVGAVSVSILISIARWDCLAPCGTTLEVDVINVGASVNNIDVDALTAVLGIKVLVEGTER